MRIIAGAPALLSILLCALLCPAQGSAQTADRLDRCLPYGSYNRKIAAMRNEKAEPVDFEHSPLRVVIDDVEFDGPISLSVTDRQTLTTRLKALPIDGEGDWLGHLQESELPGWWEDHGYYKAKLTATATTLATDRSGQRVALRVHVEEGAQFRLGTVTFRSSDPDEPLVFPTSELMKQLELREGDVLDSSKVRATIAALNLLYGSDGYIDCVVIPITDVDDQTGRIALVLELDQQKQFRIRNIEVLTTNSVVRSSVESSIKSGDVFNITLVQRVLKENASFLPHDVSDRDMILQRDVKTATVDMRLELEPCPQLHD
jgi:hypothetical protein